MRGSYTYKPAQFFLITNAIMWTAWLTAAYFSYQTDGGHGKLISTLELIGLFSPSAAALWMIFTSRSTELKANIHERLINLKLIRPWTILATALIIPAAAIISIILSHLFFGQSLDQFKLIRASPFVAGAVPLQFISFSAPLFEEAGWRSYGMDSLRGNRTFLTATLIFGALWAFWHCPLFFVKNYYHNIILRTNPLFAVNFIVLIFPVAIIINWLWFSNKGNILLAVLFHAIANLQWMLNIGDIAKCIETVVLIVIAIIVVGSNKNIFFSKFPTQIGYFD